MLEKCRRAVHAACPGGAQSAALSPICVSDSWCGTSRGCHAAKGSAPKNIPVGVMGGGGAPAEGHGTVCPCTGCALCLRSFSPPLSTQHCAPTPGTLWGAGVECSPVVCVWIPAPCLLSPSLPLSLMRKPLGSRNQSRLLFIFPCCWLGKTPGIPGGSGSGGEEGGGSTA